MQESPGTNDRVARSVTGSDCRIMPFIGQLIANQMANTSEAAIYKPTCDLVCHVT